MEDKRYQRYRSTNATKIETSNVGIQTELYFVDDKRTFGIEGENSPKEKQSMSLHSDPNSSSPLNEKAILQNGMSVMCS